MSPMPFLRGALICGLLAAATASTAHADEKQAAELFRAAEAAFARGDHAAAASAFQEADRQSPSGAALYNAGRAWQAASHWARAANAYEQALARGDLPAPLQGDARRNLASLRPRVVLIRIVEPAGALVQLNEDTPAPIPVRRFVVPGAHRVRFATLPGTPTVQVNAVAGEERVVSAPVLPGNQDQRSVPAVSSTAPVAAPVASGPDYLGWSLLGVAAAAGATAVALGILTLEARNDFRGSGYTDRDARDRTVRLRLYTNVAAATAAAAGGWAGWRLLFSGDEEVRAALAPRGLLYQGSF